MGKFCLQLYKQVFYRLYLWDKKVSRSRKHEWNVALTLSVYTLFNLASMVAVTQLITGYRMIDMLAVSAPKLYGIVTMIIIYAAHYLLLSRLGIKNIINEFEGPQAKYKLNKPLVLWYEILSVLLFFGSFYLVGVRDYFN
jgi:hypothetical protein